MGKEILTEVKLMLRPDAQELLEIRDGKWSDELVEYVEAMITISVRFII
jgi:hypothetical protein